MDSKSDMEVVYNNIIICTCICIHNIHNSHSSKTNILFHILYYTDKNNTPHYRCTHACTHQPLVSICDLNDLKLSWQLYEIKSSQGISHAMVEFRNCQLLSIIAAWCDDRVHHGYKYSMWPHHLTGWLLKTSLNLFLDGSSRHIYLLPFLNKHWTSVFFLIRAIYIKRQWNLFTMNILFN